MYKFGIFLVIFAVLSVALASLSVTVSLTPPQDFSHPDHPGKCLIRGDLILTPGKHTDPNNACIKYNCKEDGSGSIETTSREGCDPEYVKQLQASLPEGVVF